MGNERLFEEMIDLARRLGMTVRNVHLGGSGGGLARVKDERQLFIDLDATPDEQLEQMAAALGGLRELEELFIRPDLRQLLDSHRLA